MPLLKIKMSWCHEVIECSIVAEGFTLGHLTHSLSYYKADVPQTCSYLLTTENQQFLNISLKRYVKWPALGLWERWRSLKFIKCYLFCQGNKRLLSGCCKNQEKYLWVFVISDLQWQRECFPKDLSQCFIKSNLCFHFYSPKKQHGMNIRKVILGL